jgi:SAM-dependent methyltransferase
MVWQMPDVRSDTSQTSESLNQVANALGRSPASTSHLGLAHRALHLLPDGVRRHLTRVAHLGLLVYRLAGRPVTTRSLLLMLSSKPDSCRRTCPICGYAGAFNLTTYGTPPRWDSSCPRCTSNERNRLMFLTFMSLQIDRTSKILHFAPEKSLEPRLRSEYPEYRTSGLKPGRTDLTLNIEEIGLATNTVDVILCSHVLEHVDDKKAMPELFRILKSGGRLLAMVPIIEGWERTYENPAIINLEDRRIHFGRVDHLRWYGADFRTRLKSAGFDVSEYTAEGIDAVEHALLRGEKVFICRKHAKSF